jgi:hypothetical protein
VDVEHQPTDLVVRRGCWPVPHNAVPFRSDMATVADWSAAGCPAWPLPQRPNAPAVVAGVRRAQGVRAPGVRQAASGVRASGQPVPAGRVDLAHVTSADAQPQHTRRCVAAE